MLVSYKENLAISTNDGIMESVEVGMEELFRNPKKLGEHTPAQWHEILKQNGHNPIPLGDGSLTDRQFSDGGGYRVLWGGDRIFMYHPAVHSHHGSAYYKLSSGTTGKLRFDLNGNPIKKRRR